MWSDHAAAHGFTHRTMLQQYLRTKQTEFIQWGSVVSQSKTKASPQKSFRNIYLTVHCVTAVLEPALLCQREITKRYFGLSELQCLRVSWLKLDVNMCRDDGQKHTSMDTEHKSGGG